MAFVGRLVTKVGSMFAFRMKSIGTQEMSVNTGKYRDIVVGFFCAIEFSL
jgi:hypothetical protein